MNSAQDGDKCAGMAGGSEDVATWNKAAKLVVYSDHGGLPVAVLTLIDRAEVTQNSARTTQSQGTIEGLLPISMTVAP